MVKVFIGVACILLIAYFGMWLGQKYGTYRVVVADTPCIVMFAGSTARVSAYLLYKPSGETDFHVVDGTIEFFRSGDCYSLAGSSALGTVSSATGPLNSDTFLIAEDGISSVMGVRQTLTGVQPGQGELQISGDSTGGDSHRELDIPVEVVANDGTLSLSDLFARASSRAGGIWHHTGLGNLMVNFFGGTHKGLCDQWADWVARWFIEQNDGTICKVEKVWFGQNNWWRVNHVCVRITFCESGRVLYVDPHQDPDNPYMGVDEYEGQVRRGPPTRSETWYSR